MLVSADITRSSAYFDDVEHAQKSLLHVLIERTCEKALQLRETHAHNAHYELSYNTHNLVFAIADDDVECVAGAVARHRSRQLESLVNHNCACIVRMSVQYTLAHRRHASGVHLHKSTTCTIGCCDVPSINDAHAALVNSTTSDGACASPLAAAAAGIVVLAASSPAFVERAGFKSPISALVAFRFVLARGARRRCRSVVLSESGVGSAVCALSRTSFSLSPLDCETNALESVVFLARDAARIAPLPRPRPRPRLVAARAPPRAAARGLPAPRPRVDAPLDLDVARRPRFVGSFTMN
jgi:hypothetical protein